MSDINAMQTRLARYYLGRLRTANTIYRRAPTSSAESTALLGQEWAQIAHWQAWAATHSAQQTEAARLCASYAQAGTDILITRQSLHERVAWLDAGLAAARAIGDARATAVCLIRLAWTIYKQTHVDRAEDLVRQALAQSKAIHDRRLIGQSLHLLGEIAMRRAALEEAEHLCLRSVKLLQAIDAQAALADVYFSLSETAYLRGDPVRARDYAQQCYHIQLALGLNPTTNNNLTWLGAMTVDAGDLDAGEAYIRESVALCRASGAQSTLAHALMNLSEFMLLRDAWEEARGYAEEGLQIAQAIGEMWLVPYGLLWRASCYARSGEHAAAQATIGQAVALARAGANQITLQVTLIHQAEIQIGANDVEAARVALHEALAAAVEAGLRGKTLHGVLVAARLWHRRGDAIHAAEWAGLLSNARGLDYAERKDVQSLCAALLDALGMETYAAALERGKRRRVDTVVAWIVQGLAGADPRDSRTDQDPV